MKQLLLLLALISPSFAQLPNIDYAGHFFMTQVVTNNSGPIRKVNTLPATCTTVGSASSSNAVLYQGRVYLCTATDTWTATLTTTTGANAALSNLASVAINTALLPGSNNAIDLGNTSKWFRDVYIGTSGSFYGILRHTPTANRTITFPDASITVAGSASALTSGRVPFVTTGGLLTDSENLQWNNASLYFQVGPATAAQAFHLSALNKSVMFRMERTGSSTGVTDLGTDVDGWKVWGGGYDFSSGHLVVKNAQVAVSPTSAASLLAQFSVTNTVASRIVTVIRGTASQSANIVETQNSSGTALTTIDAAGRIYPVTIAFASLGTPADGAMVYCNDCAKATPCAGSGTGALAKRLNGAWDCD